MGYLFHHKGIFLTHLWLIFLTVFSVNLLPLHPATSPHYLLSLAFLYSSNSVPPLFNTIRWPMAPTFTAHLTSGNDPFPPSVWRDKCEANMFTVGRISYLSGSWFPWASQCMAEGHWKTFVIWSCLNRKIYLNRKVNSYNTKFYLKQHGEKNKISFCVCALHMVNYTSERIMRPQDPRWLH